MRLHEVAPVLGILLILIVLAVPTSGSSPAAVPAAHSGRSVMLTSSPPAPQARMSSVAPYVGRVTSSKFIGVNITSSVKYSTNLVCTNLTVAAGVTLNMSGHQIICNGVIVNHGWIVPGPSSRQDYLSSYGGSGGGGQSQTCGTTGYGYSTRAQGGNGSNNGNINGGNGSTPTAPSPFNANAIKNWSLEGMENFTAGAAGEEVCPTQHLILGGVGSNGLYVQGSTVTLGTVLANGTEGAGTCSAWGMSGSGGGGVVIIAYGTGGYSAAGVNISGPAGVPSCNGKAFAGAGGTGQILTLGYGTTPPIVPTLIVSVSTAPTHDVGQMFLLRAITTGGFGFFSYVWSGLPSGCNTLNTPELNCTASAPGWYNASVMVSDGTNSVGAFAPFRVFADPAISSFAAAISPTNVNATDWLNVSATGGAKPYTYAYTGLPPGCTSSNTSSLVCVPTGTGTFTVRVFVNDSAEESVNSAASLSVRTALTSVAISPTSPTVYFGGTQAFTATAMCSPSCPPSGVTFTWTLTSSKLGSISPATGTTVTFTAGNTPATGGIFVNASLNEVTQSSSTVITVTTTPTITLNSVAVSPATASVNSGGTQAFTAKPTCSSTCPAPELTYSWTLTNPTLGSITGTGTSVVFMAGDITVTGGIFVNATLNDVTEESNAVITVTTSVTSVLTSVALSPAAPSVSPGGMQIFTATPACVSTCPTSGISYVWALTNVALGSISGTGASVTYTAGTIAMTGGLFVNATLDEVTEKASAMITVSTSGPTISSVAISPTNPALQTGGSITFTATPSCSGGTCPTGTTYAWSLNDNLGNLSTLQGYAVTFTAGNKAGEVRVFVNATLNGKTVENSAIITISTVPESSGSSGFSFAGLSLWILIGILVAVVAVVLILYFAWWSRREDMTEGVPQPRPASPVPPSPTVTAPAPPTVPPPQAPPSPPQAVRPQPQAMPPSPQAIAAGPVAFTSRPPSAAPPAGSPPPWPMVPMTVVVTDDAKQFWAMVSRSGVPRDHLLVVSNDAPSSLATSFGLAGARFVRLARTEGEDHVSPADIDLLGNIIENHLQGESNRAVVLHGIDMVMDSSSPKAVRRLIQVLREIAESSRGAVLVHLNPTLLPATELPALEEGANVIRLG